MGSGGSKSKEVKTDNVNSAAAAGTANMTAAEREKHEKLIARIE
jgi:hypothetical protein